MDTLLQRLGSGKTQFIGENEGAVAARGLPLSFQGGLFLKEKKEALTKFAGTASSFVQHDVQELSTDQDEPLLSLGR